MNRRNESTINTIIDCDLRVLQFSLKSLFSLFELLKLYPSDSEETFMNTRNKINSVFTTDKIFPQEIWQH